MPTFFRHMARFMNVAHFSRKPKLYRNLFDPLQHYDDKELFSRYRFDRNGIMYLSDILRRELENTSARSRAIPVETQICVALRYLASNDFQLGVADDFNLSQSEVSLIVDKFVDALSVKANNFVKFPVSVDAVNETKLKFFQVAEFPCVVGCIDCTHIRIQAPHHDENDYVNRKSFHSINVQAVCDAAGKITNFVAKWPGSTHDSFILRNSLLWEGFELGRLEGIILGDSGYPNRNWLFTPFRNPITPWERQFNNRHSKTRVLIENAFGRLKRRFSILHSEVRLKPEKVVKVIATCIILHNIAIDMNLHMNESVELEQFDDAHEVPANMLNAAGYRDMFAMEVFG